MKRMLLIGLVMASISISSIHAVGPCELYDHHVTYRGFSEKYRQIAIQESYSFCVESEAFSREMSKAGFSSDQALAFQFVTMYQTDGSVIRRYLVQGDARILSILNDTARQEVDFLNAYIDGGLISPQSIENVLTEGGFIAGASSLVSPSGKLKIQLVAPLVGEAAVPYRWAIFNIVPVERVAGLPPSHLATFKKRYTGLLSFECWWINSVLPGGAASPILVLRMVQSGAWAPGTGYTNGTQELYILNTTNLREYSMVDGSDEASDGFAYSAADIF